MKKAIYFLCGLLLLAQVMGCDAQLMVEPDPSVIEGNGEDVNVLGEGGQREPEQFVALYFLDPLETYLFPLSYPVTAGTSVQELIKHLNTGPIRKEWGKSPVPRGITIQDIDLVGERALVNLKVADSFKGFEPGQEEFLATSIVYTLTSYPGISRIEFLQDNNEPTKPFELLARQNLLTQEDLAINSLEDKEGESPSVQLWFSNKDVLYMVPVSHYPNRIPDGVADLALLLVNALIEGPGSDLPLLKSFPAGTEVLSVKAVDQTIEIDFNRLFVENFPGGSAQEWAILNSLVLTLTEIPEIQYVQILVEGRKEAAALGHMYTAEPLIRGVVNWVLIE